MTELQMGLAGLGATAVIGVLAFNKWQEYRQRKIAEAILAPRHEDVLLAEKDEKAVEAAVEVRQEPALEAVVEGAIPERLEPSLGGDVADDIPEVTDELEAGDGDFSAESADVMESARPAEPHAVEPGTSPNPGLLPAELLDPRIELIAAFDFATPIAVAQAVQAQRATLARLHKPVHWVAFNESNGEWQRVQPDSVLPVRQLRIALQLANRQGPVADSDIATFTHAMHALAADWGIACDLSPEGASGQAAQIDRFCAGVDLEIGINIVSRAAAFPGTKIRTLAEAEGMALGNEGGFVRFDEAGRPLFSLINFESTAFSADSLRTLTTHGVTFLLDVPCAAEGEVVWGQMTDMARRFAESLQGELVDDNRQPLNAQQLDHIRREFIAKPQAAMTAYGLPAGSPQARRLFS